MRVMGGRGHNNVIFVCMWFGNEVVCNEVVCNEARWSGNEVVWE